MDIKVIDWTKVLQPELAYTAAEIAAMLEMNIITTRRYLRRSADSGTLRMRLKGRVKLYTLPKVRDE